MKCATEAIKHVICNTPFSDEIIAKEVNMSTIEITNVRKTMKGVYGGLLE